MNSTSLKEVWTLALQEEVGLGVSNVDVEELEQELIAFRNEHPEWEELKQFYFVKVKDELRIFRARNTLPARTDGDYAPLED